MKPHCALLLALLLSLGIFTLAIEFQVDFLNQPARVSYNFFYGKYELTMELKITEVGPLNRNNPRLVTGMQVRVEEAMNKNYFGAAVLARVYSGGAGGQLVVQCSSLLRCLQMQRQIGFRPAFIQQAVEFTPEGLLGGIPVQFSSVRSTKMPAAAPPALEVVFQQHLDNSLSFAQNWETYANGFGDPSGNYWMGLEQLSALTKDRTCDLIYEAALFNGSVLTATYYEFQVLRAYENYMLLVSIAGLGSQLYHMREHNQMAFSTFDRDNDKGPGSCSTSSAGNNVGFWYIRCFDHNPNNPIVSEANLASANCYYFCTSPDLAGNRLCLKRTKLSFRCS